MRYSLTLDYYINNIEGIKIYKRFVEFGLNHVGFFVTFAKLFAKSFLGCVTEEAKLYQLCILFGTLDCKMQ
jgi:hypothetical protein